MASHEQSYGSGEAKGQAQEKAGQTLESMRDKTQLGKDKASEMGHSAHDCAQEKKDQTGSYISDETGAAWDKIWGAAHATKEKTSETAEGAKERAAGAAQATKERASEMSEKARETAQAGKEKTGGMLQKTREQVKSMAQGAADAVKHTLGMAEDTDQNKDKDHPIPTLILWFCTNAKLKTEFRFHIRIMKTNSELPNSKILYSNSFQFRQKRKRNFELTSVLPFSEFEFPKWIRIRSVNSVNFVFAHS